MVSNVGLGNKYDLPKSVILQEKSMPRLKKKKNENQNGSRTRVDFQAEGNPCDIWAMTSSTV